MRVVIHFIDSDDQVFPTISDYHQRTFTVEEYSERLKQLVTECRTMCMAAKVAWFCHRLIEMGQEPGVVMDADRNPETDHEYCVQSHFGYGTTLRRSLNGGPWEYLIDLVPSPNSEYSRD